MTYKVLLIKSTEGFAVSCPGLPGCWSQGETREEALRNIKEAIKLWLEVAEEDIRRDAALEHEEIASETGHRLAACVSQSIELPSSRHA